jgi:hypothetical protein
MALNSPNSELNLSKSKVGVGFPYWQEQLNVYWTEVKRSAIYEYDTIHGLNCLCCSKIPKDSIVPKKPKMGRKTGGHNRK